MMIVSEVRVIIVTMHTMQTVQEEEGEDEIDFAVRVMIEDVVPMQGMAGISRIAKALLVEEGVVGQGRGVEAELVAEAEVGIVEEAGIWIEIEAI
mmetsp:Transcript_67507/g.107209  ORF Transcript_67507/g.107209 Transcript_67507/m.107209 type:complete len:95 (+) Transcript_67507:227-511(+)